MSISSEITRISNAKTAIAESIANKGVTVPSGTKIDGMATLIDSIETGGSGDTSETWVLNNTLNTASPFSFSANFISNGASYTGFRTYGKPSIVGGYDVEYTRSSGSTTNVYLAEIGKWLNQYFRKLTFDTPPTADLLAWLQENGVKQPVNLAVQDSNALTITSNGTVSVTPDAPYDALRQVDLTVNTSSRATVSITNENSTTYECHYMLPSGTWESVPTYLKKGTTTFDVMQYSPIFLYISTKAITNLNNFIKTSDSTILGSSGRSYTICYATSSNASATISMASAEID